MGVNVPNFGPGTEPGVLRRWAQTVEGARDGSRGNTSPSGATMTEEVTEVVPDLVVAGPVPDLAEQVRDLHRRFRSA